MPRCTFVSKEAQCWWSCKVHSSTTICLTWTPSSLKTFGSPSELFWVQMNSYFARLFESLTWHQARALRISDSSGPWFSQPWSIQNHCLTLLLLLSILFFSTTDEAYLFPYQALACLIALLSSIGIIIIFLRFSHIYPRTFNICIWRT